MNLKYLNKNELHSKLKSLIVRERELLHEILLTIKEIDQRRLYLDFGYANLFAYLTEELGYSAGSAQRRIEAARLMKELPGLGEQIESGEIKLTQISLVQKAAREVQKISSVKVSVSDKQEILQQISRKNFKESQHEVAAFFDLPIQQHTKETMQADESVRIELTLSKALYEKISLAQGLLSHAVPDKDLVAYLEYVTDRVIKQKTQMQPKAEYKAETQPGVEPEVAQTLNNNVEAQSALNTEKTATVSTSIVEVRPKFSQRVKKAMLNQQQCCQYRDPVTQKLCGSRWFLQIDHKHSQWAQGTGEEENAQVLCAEHNRQKYLKEDGRKFV